MDYFKQSECFSGILRKVAILAWTVACAASGLAVEPYPVEISPSIDEEWRWTELEALEGIGYDYVDEGPDGSLWFAGTDGLVARYNGVSLERFDFSGEVTVKAFELSQDGRVYALAERKLYELVEGEWQVLIDTEYPSGFHNMHVGPDGTVWISAWQSLLWFKENEVRSVNLGFDWVFSMLVDHDDRLWISFGTAMDLRVYDIAALFTGKTDALYHFEGNSSGRTIEIALDALGRVWALEPSLDGFCYYFEDYQRKVATRNLGDLYENARDQALSYGLEVATLPSGRVWVGSRSTLVEAKEDGADYFPFDNRISSRLPVLLGLSNERLLIGGREARTHIVDLSTERWVTYPELNYQCEDLEGTQWFLEHSGRLVARKSESDSWTAFGEKDGLVSKPNSAFCSSDGTVWVSGSHNGVAAVSYRVNGDWIREEFFECGHSFSHLSAHELAGGEAFFGGGSNLLRLGERYGGGVVYRKISGRWVADVLADGSVPRRPAVSVERVPGELWFGGPNLNWEGHVINGDLQGLAEAEHYRWVDDIVSDGRGGLWMAIWGQGIFHFGEEGVWKQYTREDGLLSDQVLHLHAALEFNGVWALTADGICHFDGVAWTNWSFPLNRRFIRESTTIKEGPRGELWINLSYRRWFLGGQRDESRASDHMSFMYRRGHAPPDTRIREMKTEFPEGSPLVVNWTGSDQWSETPSSGLEFSWRLEKGAWSRFSKDGEVVINGIEAGRHQFEVRSRDWDWNVDSTPASVSIEIVPPLWKRTWFVVTTVVTFSFIVFLLYRLFQARVRSALAMEEFKLDFFTNISHELRNPLAVILGPLESLLREEEETGKRKRLNLALRSARKMQGLVGQLLQFRKIELGKASYRPAPGELVGFLREVVELQAPLGEDRGVTVKLDTNEEHLVCSYDADKLQKIVDNLISNAIKYSPNERDVYVGANTKIRDGLMELDLCVEDQGPGIPRHEIDLVTNPFYRVGASRDTQDGFGIGLALVGGLVKLWGGEIEFESPIAGKSWGTRVHVYLPLEYAHEDEIDALGSQVVGVKKPTLLNLRAKVLLVEDNSDLRGFIRDELSRDYEVFEAENGQVGLEMVSKLEPDLVVTDVMMPEMNGFDLCRKLRSDPATSHIQIIMLTAKSAEEHSVEGMEAGADVYFAKPLNLPRLQVQIENLLEMRRNMQRRFSEQLVVEPMELSNVETEQDWLASAIAYVEKDMSDPDFDLDGFAKEMGLGRTALYKKLKALTGESPGSFVRSMRLKRAAQLLRSENLPIAKILEFIGILDQSYFSRAFKKEFGMSPSRYAKEYRAVASD